MRNNIGISFLLVIALVSAGDLLCDQATGRSATTGTIQKARDSQGPSPVDASGLFAIQHNAEAQAAGENSQSEPVPCEEAMGRQRGASPSEPALDSEDSRYLKLSGLIEISPSTKIVIYPFHTYL